MLAMDRLGFDKLIATRPSREPYLSAPADNRPLMLAGKRATMLPPTIRAQATAQPAHPER